MTIDDNQSVAITQGQSEARACIFCGKREAKLTAEHVLPKWLQLEVGGSLKGGFRGLHVDLVGSVSERKASGNSLTLRDVCGHCNSGWMSDLETAFGALLPRLRSSTAPNAFSKGERHTIAAWVVKTGIVAHRSANYRQILPEGIAMQLRQGKAMPGAVRVFAAPGDLKGKVQWHQSNLFAEVRHSDLPHFDPRRDTFLFALMFDDVSIGFGWHNTDKSYEIACRDASLHQIYPHPKAGTATVQITNPSYFAASLVFRRRSS
jgi:hypothetical protein